MICGKQQHYVNDGETVFSHSTLCYILSTDIYEGILTSASPMAAHYQHVCNRFDLSVPHYCSTTYKTLLFNQY